jgi:hypothetical protein
MSDNKLFDALELVDSSGNMTTLNQIGFTNTLAGVNVQWSQLNTLEAVTSSFRLNTGAPNKLVLNDTLEANNNYLAPTIVSQLSAIPLGDAKLILKKDTGGAVFEEVDLTQNGVSYTTPAGTTTTETWANIITGAGATPNLSAVLVAGNSAGSTSINMNNNAISGVNNLTLQTGSITFPDTTIQTTAFTGAGATPNLSQVLTAGNTATGANALIGLTNSGVGYTSNPQLTLDNSNATAGTTTGIPSVEYYKSGRNAVATDIIGSNHFYAKNFAGTKTEFAKIEASVRNTASGNDDGSIGFSGLINGVMTEFFRVNGADSENNCFLPLDMNGQSIKTSSTNLTLSATGSSGTGSVIIQPNSATGDLQFDGTNIQSISSGGDSGQRLRIKLNGVYYKIFLQDD